ncbi:MAG: histidine kinase [Aeromicrobium sp.]|nr:histidine kinase [Aeromicrobium sp.]
MVPGRWPGTAWINWCLPVVLPDGAFSGKVRREPRRQPVRPHPGLPAPDPTDCEQGPLHIPGAIQPQGLQLALDQDRRIVTASADTARLVGRPACDLIGDDPRTVLGAAPASVIAQALANGDPTRLTATGSTAELCQRLAVEIRRIGVVERRDVQIDDSTERLHTIAVMTDHDRALDTWIDDLLTAVPGTLDDDLRIVALRLTGAPS